MSEKEREMREREMCEKGRKKCIRRKKCKGGRSVWGGSAQEVHNA